MTNALSSMGGPPPAPDIPQQQQGNGAAPSGQPAAPPPPPSHQQTVAALRHFNAIEQELTGLLKDPDLGKADLKSKFIDGATKLVAQGMMTAAQAVQQLGTIPQRPFDQKKWVETHFAQTIQGANAVLGHHQQAFLGQQVDATPPSPDDHQAVISSLTSQYNGGKPQ